MIIVQSTYDEELLQQGSKATYACLIPLRKQGGSASLYYLNERTSHERCFTPASQLDWGQQ